MASSVSAQQDQPVGQLVTRLGYRHMRLEQFAAGLDASDKALQGLPLFDPLGEGLDDGFPGTAVEPLGNALVHQDFDIPLGLADKDQDTGSADGMVQVLFEKLPPR